jgi:hypothetical protein
MCVSWFIFVFFFENVSHYLLSFRVALSKEQLGTLPFQCCACSKELLITNFYIQQILPSHEGVVTIYFLRSGSAQVFSKLLVVLQRKKILKLLFLKPASSIGLIFVLRPHK